jgi:hypothetical protein
MVNVMADSPSVGVKPEKKPPSAGRHGESSDVCVAEWFYVVLVLPRWHGMDGDLHPQRNGM